VRTTRLPPKLLRVARRRLRRPPVADAVVEVAVVRAAREPPAARELQARVVARAADKRLSKRGRRLVGRVPLDPACRIGCNIPAIRQGRHS